MDQLLTQFIRALRNADIRISTAETLDALNAVKLVGYGDRQLLKDSLALALPKTVDEKAAFDTCFDQFFSSGERSNLLPPAHSMANEDSAFAPGEAAGSGGGGGTGSEHGRTGAPTSSAGSQEHAAVISAARGDVEEPGRGTAPRSVLGQLLIRSNEIEINLAINSAGQQVDVHGIEVFTQKGVYTRRIMDAMGHAELQREIGELDHSNVAADRRLARDLTARRDWLRERVRNYVEHQFLLHADVNGRRLREDLLRNVRLSALEQRHHRHAQELVLRMARRLAATYSHRKKVFRRGQLHVPRTVRHNLKYDDAIFDLRWKSVKLDRPRILAVCDVSGSVADHARFMLMFLYSLGEVLPKVRSFVFSAQLGEVTELFAHHRIEDAIALALRQYGSGSTDYGQALVELKRLGGETIDRRTTVIVLGDARNNYGDPRSDVLRQIYERSRRVIWLNPEPRAMWNTGDSDMRQYAACCHQVDECSTLKHLERVIGRLLRST